MKNCFDQLLWVNDMKLSGKRVLMRVDFNVPLDPTTGKISNMLRILAVLPTINFILDSGARSLVLISHLGRPKGKIISSLSLFPVAICLEKLLKRPIKFLPDCIGETVEKACLAPEEGSIFLLENLRFHPEEQRGSYDFGYNLSLLGDVYVNDAFGMVHRSHSSIMDISLSQRGGGLLMKKELNFFNRVLSSPKRPLLCIIGGAKVSDKIGLIENLFNVTDKMIIGGGMAFTFKRVAFGVRIGASLFDSEGAKLVPRILAKAKLLNVELLFPVDYVTANKFSNDATIGKADDETGIDDGLMGLDIGPKSVHLFSSAMKKASTIIWNGPMGVFEFKPFSGGTQSLMNTMTAVTKMGATTLICGGDTANAAQKFDSMVDHISTGGGSSLAFLEGKNLPGLDALLLEKISEII